MNSRVVGQVGAASIESIIAFMTLIPIFFAATQMAKIGDMNNSVVQGSRYLAWERTITTESVKNNEQTLEELDSRLMRTNNAPVSSTALSDEQKGQNLFWRTFRKTGTQSEASEQARTSSRAASSKSTSDEKFKYTALYDSAASFEITEDQAPGASKIIADVLDPITKLLDFVADGNKFDVNTDGLFQANIELDIGNTQYLDSKNTNCGDAQVFTCIRRHNVILADTWAASSPTEVTETVRSFVPSRPMKPLAQFAGALGRTYIVDDLKPFEYSPGHVEPDEIPLDRLGD